MPRSFDPIIDIQEETPLALPKPRFRRFLRTALGRCLIEANLSHTARLELSMLIVSEAKIATLNQTWLKRQGPTDVLSFPQQQPGQVRGHLGDIVICPGIARAEARRRHRSYRSEIERLAVHGMLHLLGFDHETDDGTMRRLERRIMTSLPTRRQKRAS